MQTPPPSPTRSHSATHQRIGSAAPVLIIVIALAISAAVFFLFTRKKIEAEKNLAAQSAAPKTGPTASAPQTNTTAPQPGAPKQPGTAATPAVPSTGNPAPQSGATATTPSSPAKFGFARPLDAAQELARALATGDMSTAAALAAAGDPSQTDAAAALMKNLTGPMGLKIGPADQVQVVGQVDNFTRVAIPFVKPDGSIVRLQLDLERDEKMGWKIGRLHLPKELAAALPAATTSGAAPATPGASAAPTATGPTVAMAPGSATPPVPPAPGMSSGKGTPAALGTTTNSLFVVDETQDALSFSSDFVGALLRHEFTTARELVVESKVPAERLAGLCIVFEEGEYELKPGKPLILTVANPEVSWVIAQVQSEKLQQNTEFGLELQRDGIDKPWRVVGLNLSDILGSFAQSASKMGVPYTPIVSNPRGGESLALYFEYDSADLHPRALKQLEIVSGLLKSDSKKKLTIAGHTDAMGTDDYNIRLSQSRAEIVKKKLAALGVAAEQIVTTAVGKAQPLSPNQKADGTDDPEGRSRNRRAEIYLDF